MIFTVMCAWTAQKEQVFSNVYRLGSRQNSNLQQKGSNGKDFDRKKFGRERLGRKLHVKNLVLW